MTDRFTRFILAVLLGICVGVLIFERPAAGQEPEAFLEPPPFFMHPVIGALDPYRGNCRRKNGADCCSSSHCVPVPSDDLGRLQLTPDGPFVDPYTIVPPPSICDSSALPPLYNALDHACYHAGVGSNVECVILRGGSV